MAPSRSTSRMMQVTEAAFQTVASLNEQATDTTSHTSVKIAYTLSSPVMSPANPMVDTISLTHLSTKDLALY